jgi:hypothetical protein
MRNQPPSRDVSMSGNPYTDGAEETADRLRRTGDADESDGKRRGDPGADCEDGIP